VIIHFADRKFNIICVASTMLPSGIVITEDKKEQEIETGIASLSFKLPYTKETRELVEKAATEGNYLFKADGEDNEFYTIIDTELDTDDESIYVYAEDAGLDLLNEVALRWPSEVTPASELGAHDLTWYFTKFLTDGNYGGGSIGGGDTGFEIGLNESGSETKELSWSDEDTLTARLLDIASQFGCEISFSFTIEGLVITHKYINIHKKRGSDNGVKLKMGHEVSRITIKKSIANVATALKCTGSADDSGVEVNLEGYSYDDGDFYVMSGSLVCSRIARSRWSRYLAPSEPGQISGGTGDIVKTFTYDTVDQATLCQQAVTELKKIRDPEVTYEVELNYLPDNVRLGDTVTLIDEEAALYVSARILKLEKSEYDDKQTATLGDYVIKQSGVAQELTDLAKRFENFSKNRPFYTWTAYADDALGTGISLDPEGKAYIGTAANKTTGVVDISDPTVFTWIKAKGEAGADANVLRIDSSRGTVFKNNQVSTVLSVTVYTAGLRITDISALRAKYGAGAYLQWYWQRLDDDDYGIIVASDPKLSDDGFRLTLTPEDVDTKVTFRCELITA